MPEKVTFTDALIDATVAVAVLVPVHILFSRARLSFVSALVLLLVFFLPPFLGAFRLAMPSGMAPTGRVIRAVTFGFELGLLVGLVGAIEKLAASALIGPPLPVPLFLWLATALFFAVGSAIAYALIVLAIHTIKGVHADPREVYRYIFPERPARGAPEPSARSALKAAAFSLVPGLGHYYLGWPERGAGFLLLAIELGTGAICAGLAGLIIGWESRVNLDPFLVLFGALVLSLPFLAVVSALDALMIQPRPAPAAGPGRE